MFSSADFIARSANGKLPVVRLLVVTVGALVCLPVSRVYAADQLNMDQMRQLIVVDKSLLIRDFLQYDGKVLAIVRPNGWGKSVNLNMLSKFLELELDENDLPISSQSERRNRALFVGDAQIRLRANEAAYRLESLKIASDERVMKEQGEQTVIRISLTEVTGVSFHDILNRMKNVVKDLFERFLYAKASLKRPEDQEEFDIYRRGNQNAEKLTDSVRFLSRCLTEHYRNRTNSSSVYIMIDDYDRPLLHLYFNLFERRFRNQNYGPEETDRKNVTELSKAVVESDDFADAWKYFHRFFVSSFERNEWLRKAFVTGVIGLPILTESANDTENSLYGLQRPEFSEHYGYNSQDVSRILGKLNNVVNMKVFDTWYAYKFDSNTKVLYCPLMVQRFLKQGLRYDYEDRTDEQDRFLTLMLSSISDDKEGLLDLVKNLVNGGGAWLKISATMDFTDFNSVLFHYLLQNGYLTSKRYGYGGRILVVVNEEMRTSLEAKLYSISD